MSSDHKWHLCFGCRDRVRCSLSTDMLLYTMLTNIYVQHRYQINFALVQNVCEGLKVVNRNDSLIWSNEMGKI